MPLYDFVLRLLLVTNTHNTNIPLLLKQLLQSLLLLLLPLHLMLLLPALPPEAAAAAEASSYDVTQIIYTHSKSQ